MSLSNYPPVFDGTELPFFPEIEVTPEEYSRKNRSEGGRIIKTVVRRNRLSASVSLALADFTWVQFFYQKSQLSSFIFKQYSPLTNGYVEYTVTMENFKYKNKKGSDKLTAVTGVWDVSFNLEEF